uniref:Small ribosomal subunit protein uS3c n=1 Tax=Sciaphila densiflora TaxID=548678 RepID=A0A0K0QW43_9LILI|nr:ribosomal protein S3 [Sciaphila densiflora]AKR17951.1 ribosomal protein S3 [Sciaphila densiflora]
MGQKINPLGFRLGTTKSHHSFWFSQPKNYSMDLHEDKKIRDYIKKYVQKKRKVSPGFEGITHIEIKRRINFIQVRIHIGFQNSLIEGRTRGIKELQTKIQKKFHFVNRRFYIAITRVEKPYGQPNILAEYLALQLTNKIAFRKAMKKAIELTEQTDTKGIQVQIAGRIGGKEIARVEWIRKGRVPLQTIRAKIYYCSYPIQTFYGVLGIKIWVFVGGE